MSRSDSTRSRTGPSPPKFLCIAQLMEEGPFRDFAFLFIDRAVKGELYVGDKPNLRSILKYAQSGIGTLLDRCLRRFFVESDLTNWEELVVTATVKDARGRNDVSLVDGMAKLYIDRFAADDRGHETIDWPDCHFIRMTANITCGSSPLRCLCFRCLPPAKLA